MNEGCLFIGGGSAEKNLTLHLRYQGFVRLEDVILVLLLVNC